MTRSDKNCTSCIFSARKAEGLNRWRCTRNNMDVNARMRCEEWTNIKKGQDNVQNDENGPVGE